MVSFKISLRPFIDFLLPPLCLGCEAPVLESQTLCAQCWHGVHFIDQPFCDSCGLPFDFEIEGGEPLLCGACLDHPPAFDGARSAFVYNDASRDMILRFKHGDALHAVPIFSKWIGRAGREILSEADLIIPVPLHRWRLLKRRYNQAALLAKAVGHLVDVPVEVDGLTRLKATESQGHLNREQRRKNVVGVFSIKPKLNIQGKKIVLMDDVMTSGATVGECARLLKKEGAVTVNVLTLARAV